MPSKDAGTFTIRVERGRWPWTVDRLLRVAWNEQCSVRQEAAPGIRVTAADDQRPQVAE